MKDLFAEFQKSYAGMPDSEKLAELRRLAESGMRPAAFAIMALAILTAE